MEYLDNILPRAVGESRPADRVEQAALIALALFTVMAVGGYATFGLHPELMRGDARAQAFYGIAFVVFARGQVLVAAAALFVVLVRRAGITWIASALAVYAVSLTSELTGTTVGLPFGAYSYTDALGPKWLGHVPMLIPLSWFTMAVPSFAIARRIAGTSAVRRVAIASLVLLAWDLALDPAMSFANKYWVWSASGPYYGMPWLNLAGWYVTGLALMIVLSALRASRWIDALPLRWTVAYYLLNVGLAFGLCAAAGLGTAMIATLVPLVLCVVALRPAIIAATGVAAEAQ